MSTTYLNESPLKHTSRNGTIFKAARCDLNDGVTVIKPKGPITEMKLAADRWEFTAWHALCIFKQLNGFGGYGGIQYKIEN